MATYSLTGRGVQPLNAGVGALRVNVFLPPAIIGVGRADPANWYDVALLRAMDGINSYRPVPVDAQDMMMALPPGVDNLGYAIFGGATLHVVEVFETSPFVGPAGPTGPSGPAGATGPSGAGILIQRQTLSGTAASVTFSAIPNTYDSLVLESSVRSDRAVTRDELNVQFNGDTGTHYGSAGGYGGQSGSGTWFLAGADHVRVPGISGSTATAAVFSSSTLRIPRYTSTSVHKVMRVTGEQYGSGLTDAYDFFGLAIWQPPSIAAITSMLLYPVAGNFVAGCEFSLYGFS